MDNPAYLLFDPTKREDLILALLAPSPEIGTLLQVVVSEAELIEEQQDENEPYMTDQENTP